MRVYRYTGRCCLWTCVCSMAACAAPERVCLQEPVLHRCVSVYKSLCCTGACLSTRACATPVRVCLQEPVLHLCLSVYKNLCRTGACLSTRALRCSWTCLPVGVHCTIYKILCCLFRNRNVVLVVSIHVRNTEQTEKMFFWFRETDKKQTKQIKFRFLSVQTENIFCLFRGDPTWGGGGAEDASIKIVMNIEKPCLVNLSLYIPVCSIGGKLNRNLLTFI